MRCTVLLVDGVEKVKQHLQPFEHNVQLLLRQRPLLRGLVGERRYKQRLDRYKDFFPESRHNHDHCRIRQRLFHDRKVIIEVGEKWLQRIRSVDRCGSLNDRLWSGLLEVSTDRVDRYPLT